MGEGTLTHSPTRHMAVLLLLVMVLIIGYLVMAPPEELSESLNVTDGLSSPSSRVLYSTSVGLLQPYLRGEEKISLAPINLFIRSRQEVTPLSPSLSVSRTFFSNDDREVVFSLKELSNLEYVELFFQLFSAQGGMNIYINDRLFYNGVLTHADLPLRIPVALLEPTNVIRFESFSVGWRLLSSNSFILKDLRVVEIFDEFHKQEQRLVYLPHTQNIKSASLEFFANCLQDEDGFLRILLNRQQVYQGGIVCDASLVKVPLLLSYFQEGDNTFSFEIDKGEYKLENLVLISQQKVLEYPTYYFDAFNSNTAELRLVFGNTGTKKLTAFFNGQRLHIDTNSQEVIRRVTVRQGENILSFTPQTEVDLLLAEVIVI